MSGRSESEALDLLARALSTALFVVSPNDLERAIAENVESRVGKYPDEDWGPVAGILRGAFNLRYVSSIRRLAEDPEFLASVTAEEG